MSRSAVVCSLLLGAGVLVLGRAAPAPQGQGKETKPEPLAARLAKPVKFAGLDDPKLTLGQVLEQLGKAHGLDIDVNEKAFAAEGMAQVRDQPVGEKPMRKRDQVRLDRLLRKVLARVPVPSGATYVLRQGTVEVTTNAAVRAQIWGGHGGPFLPLVNAEFNKTPLQDALRELADQAEYNVVLDNRVAEVGQTPLTARFANAPLDTAVSFLSDMADLRPVLLDNVVYVTTKENAAVLEARLKKDPLTAVPEDSPAKPRVGEGVGSPAAPAGPPGGM